ncbi:MAG: long-chain-acyl-CoA synthetase [Gammaproteobacteria bacterium]|nr:long-chain-acyl-CoA synthetase [Gammaproteobacteria bacterium]
MTTAREFLDMTRTLGRAIRLRRKVPQRSERHSLGRMLSQQAAQRPNDIALICEGQELSWGDFNTRANRVAHQLRDAGIGHGDCVALMMENRIEFLVCLMGICKLGAVASLINTHQRRDVLIHSLNLTNAKCMVYGEELIDAVDEVRGTLDLPDREGYLQVPDRPASEQGAVDVPDWAASCDPSRPGNREDDPEETAEITLGDACLYIFTSGTTGLPKAAVVSGERCIRAMQGMGEVCLNIKPSDRLYNPLPLYHTTGLVIGFGSVLHAGASMVIKRKFSASRFFDEIREHQCNSFVYIGEMCRYLVHQPQRGDDADNPVEKIIGNGLRPDIWMDFKRRFDIPKICEIYGASEGNSGFVNAFNKDCTIGFGITPHVLVQYDADRDEIIRGSDGFCIEVTKGEPGLLLNEVSDVARFDGYTDPEASEKKLVRNVLKTGDVYFNTGDLIRQIDVGFAFGRPHYQFVDRTGDTFRWKGENCSTNEVGEIINAHPQVQTSNVYGVEIPGTDGRAGMAAITFDPDQVSRDSDIDWDGLTRHIDDKLASYARPIFIRVQREQPTTSTFKLQKTELKKQAFHPDAVGEDRIYVRKPGADRYEPLDADFYARIMAEDAGY